MNKLLFTLKTQFGQKITLISNNPDRDWETGEYL